MLPFVGEILVRAWQSFLAAIGTTGLGFFTNNIEQFFALELVTWLGVWLFRGKEAMLSHKRQTFLFGAMLYLVAIVIVYLPIYLRQVPKINSEIRNDAEKQSLLSSIDRHIVPPPYAYELSAPSIAITLVPQNGFTFDLSGTYSLEHKKQYLLTFTNSAHKLSALDVEIEFPYPVEAHKIVKVSMMDGATFDPTSPVINILGAKIESSGCIGRWTYHFHAGSVAGGGTATISLILNGWSAAHPGAGPPLGNGYIAGSFMYSYRGTTTSSGYYAVFEPDQDMVIRVSEPQRQKPAEFHRLIGFTVLAGPCIPDNSLLAP
jgi:hypothetical protein